MKQPEFRKAANRRSGNAPEEGHAPLAKADLLSRRTVLLRSLGVLGGLALGVYVKPRFATVPVPKAYACATPPLLSSKAAGCSPGYWKNHTRTWPSPYTTSTKFSRVFTVPPVYASSLGSPKTLLEVLKLGGGCEQALGRQGVSALLNAQLMGKSTFGLSSAEVIQGVNAALAIKDCTKIEKAKDLLEKLNEGACLP